MFIYHGAKRPFVVSRVLSTEKVNHTKVTYNYIG